MTYVNLFICKIIGNTFQCQKLEWCSLTFISFLYLLTSLDTNLVAHIFIKASKPHINTSHGIALTQFLYEVLTTHGHYLKADINVTFNLNS